MKNLHSKKNQYQIKVNQDFVDQGKNYKTTKINILLNRIKNEKKYQMKKKIILSVYALIILSIVSIFVSGI